MARTTPLILLQSARVTLGSVPALDTTDWSLRHGEHWGILGANGAGKSTFLRLVRGDLWPDQAGGGQRLYNVGGSLQASPIGLRERMGFVSGELQERYLRREWNIRALDVVLTGPSDSSLLYHRPEKQEQRRALAAMADLGVDCFRARPFLSLSQGEARKVLLARALCAVRAADSAFPPLLVLDEVMEGLDQNSRRSLAELVDMLSREATILATAHRECDLPGCLTHTLTLDQGRIVRQGLRPSPGSPSDWAWQDAGTTSISSPLPDPVEHPRREGPVLVEVRGDVYLDRTMVLSDISWRIRQGEHWFVAGANGAGKSTLMNVVMGSVRTALGGQVIVRLPEGNGDLSVVSDDDLARWQRHIGYVSAALHATLRNNEHFTMNGLEVVLSGFFATHGLYDSPTPTMIATARDWLRRLDLSHLADRPTDSLSSGQFRRLLLARALAPDPGLIILDEPCSGLDEHSRTALLDLLSRQAAEGRTLILASHYPEDRVPAITHVLELTRGTITFAGPVSQWQSA